MPSVIQRAGSKQIQDTASLKGFSAVSCRDASYVYFSSSGHEAVVIASGTPISQASELFLMSLESLAFSALAEASFAEDWGSDVDAIYDDV